MDFGSRVKSTLVHLLGGVTRKEQREAIMNATEESHMGHLDAMAAVDLISEDLSRAVARYDKVAERLETLKGAHNILGEHVKLKRAKIRKLESQLTAGREFVFRLMAGNMKRLARAVGESDLIVSSRGTVVVVARDIVRGVGINDYRDVAGMPIGSVLKGGMNKLREFDPEIATYLAIKGAKRKPTDFRLTYVRPVAFTEEDLGDNTLYRNTEPFYFEVGLDVKGWAQSVIDGVRAFYRSGGIDVRLEPGLGGAGA